MAQLLYTMFITINHTLFHLWWKVTLVKHQKVSNHYDQDCTIMNIIFKDILILLWYQIFSSRQAKRSVIISNKHSIYELHHELPKDLRLNRVCLIYSLHDCRHNKDNTMRLLEHPRTHFSVIYWPIDIGTYKSTPPWIPNWGRSDPGPQMGGTLPRIPNGGGKITPDFKSRGGKSFVNSRL